LILHELYQDTYEKLKEWIKTHNGFGYPMMGLITLPLQVGTKTLDFLFSIILMTDQFRVRLGYPWLHSMEVVSLTMHKCLKFPFDKDIYVVHHTGFNLVSSHDKFSLDYFWLEPIKPREDFFFLSYQYFKAKCIASLSLRNMTKPPILDKTMIEPKDISQDQHNIEN
jgi:hypothetical protein